MEAVRKLQQQIQAKSSAFDKVTAEIEGKQAEQSKIAAEIEDLNAKLQAALGDLNTTSIEADSTQPEVKDVKAAPGPKPKASPKSKPVSEEDTATTEPKAKSESKSSPKEDTATTEVVPTQALLGQKTFTTIQEDEEYVPKDRREQVEAYNAKKGTEKEAKLTFHWPSACWRSKDGPLDDSLISKLSEPELKECLQQALDDHCKAQKPPGSYSSLEAPKIKYVEKYDPWPRNPNADASASVVFGSVADARRLDDTYAALSKKYLTMRIGGTDPKRKEMERFQMKRFIPPREEDDLSDNESVAESESSNITTATEGQKGKKDSLLACGIDPAIWRSRSNRWFAYDAIGRSASQLATVMGVNAPVASFDVAPEGAIHLIFSDYEQAKTFLENAGQHPTGLVCGGERLALKWARRPRARPPITASSAPKAKATPKRY